MPSASPQTFAEHYQSRALKWLALFAIFVFAMRGPIRALMDSSDFARIWGFARAWLVGANPYDAHQIYEAYSSGRGEAGLISFKPLELCAVYPPTTYPLLTPVAALEWPAAKIAFLLVNTVAFILAIATLVNGKSNARTRDRLVTCVALILAFGPTHTAFAKGQPAVIVFALLCFAIVWCGQQRFTGAAFAGSAALALKPQLALPIALYFLFRLPRRGWLVLTTTFVFVAIIALLRLGDPSAWLGLWLANTKLASASGGILDPGATNPVSYQIIGSGVLLDLLLPRAAVIWVTAALGALVVGIAIPAIRLGRRELEPLILWLLIGADLALLYHRYYDAILLIIPFGLLFFEPEVLSKRERWIACAGLAALALPLAPMLNSIAIAHPELKETLWFNGVALRLQNFAVVAMFVIPCSALIRHLAGKRGQRPQLAA